MMTPLRSLLLLVVALIASPGSAFAQGIRPPWTITDSSGTVISGFTSGAQAGDSWQLFKIFAGFGSGNTTITIVANTTNQLAVAIGAAGNSTLLQQLAAVPQADQPAALQSLSPQGYELWSDLAFSRAAALTDRLEQTPVQSSDRSLYASVDERHGHIAADIELNKSTFTSASALIGGDYRVGPALCLGGFLDFAHTRADLGLPGSNTTIKDYAPGIRATWSQGAWFASALAAYDFADYRSQRSIIFTGESAVASGSTRGQQALGAIAGGWRMGMGSWDAGTIAGLDYSNWRTDGFMETGAGAANLTVADQSAQSLRTRLGVNSGFAWKAGSTNFHTSLRATWLHECKNGIRSLNAGFGSNTFSLSTHAPHRNSALLGMEIEDKISGLTSLYADFSTEVGGSPTVSSDCCAGLRTKF